MTELQEKLDGLCAKIHPDVWAQARRHTDEEGLSKALLDVAQNTMTVYEKLLSELAPTERDLLTNLARQAGPHPPGTAAFPIESFHLTLGRPLNTLERAATGLLGRHLVQQVPAEESIVSREVLDFLKGRPKCGWRCSDPFFPVALFVQSNGHLPYSLLPWLTGAKPEERDDDEIDLLSRIPATGYLSSPRTRKLTQINGRWCWLTSEQQRSGRNAGGFQQVVYALPDRHQLAADRLLGKGTIYVHTHYYGNPIYAIKDNP
jgi:hypothetical protein